MTVTMNKQKLMSQLFALHKGGKHAKLCGDQVLEQFIFAVCREGTTGDAAEQAYAALRERFYDWNELRVSAMEEIADVLNQFIPDGEARALRLIEFLQEVFETTYSFDLENLQKKGVKQAAKQLARYKAANDYAVSWVVQKSLGGHAIPLDAGALRVLGRLGILEEGQDPEIQRTSLEHQIPKPKGADFVDLISVLAEDYCWDADPACTSCPLLKHCPTGMEAKMTAAAGNTKKPR